MRALYLLLTYNESVTAQTFDSTGYPGNDLIPEIATEHVLFYDHTEPQYRN